jgi:hypothetical protein
MFYPESKVYSDGSHFIAIPHSTNPTIRREKPPEELVEVVDADKEDSSENTDGSSDAAKENDVPAAEEKPQKEKKPKRVSTRSKIFNELYADSSDMPRVKRKVFLINGMRKYFKSRDQAVTFVEKRLEMKRTNYINRMTRFRRKAYLNDFNYFVTFTYDGSKHDETTFRKQLRKTLMNFHTRREWTYIGVWEKAPKTKRLHFHAIMNVPDGTMPGEMFEKNDYDKKGHKRQITVQNTYFNERFGRTDFEELDSVLMKQGNAMSYLTKYIAKTEEKLVYSRGLPMYVISDINGDDVVCRIGLEDKKLLLFDNFTAWDEGELIGEMSPETKKQLRTSN